MCLSAAADADADDDAGCQVTVMEVKGLKSLPANKVVYCTMEVDGGDKLQTDQAEASKPWYISRVVIFMFSQSLT